MIQNFSDYIIFVDESGDHGLATIDPEYPVFSLVFVIIKKTDYVERIVPAFQSLKIKYWGHDQVIFHENEIRKEKGHFGVLRTNSDLRYKFIEELSAVIKDAPFQYVASVIRKDRLVQKYVTPFSPYQIGLLFCLEKAMEVILKNGQENKLCHVLIEGRGSKEDRDLELEFRRICDNQRKWGYKPTDFGRVPFQMFCIDKKSNSSGLQLADLIARPIALKILRPEQANKTHDILKEKNAGTKCFP